MIRTYVQQKSGLTRAVRTGDAGKIETECRRALQEWQSQAWRDRHGTNAWPDDWHRWNIALGDATRGRLDMDSI